MLVKLMKTKFDYLEEALIFNPFLRCRLQTIECMVTFLEKIVLFIVSKFTLNFFCKVYLWCFIFAQYCSILKLLPIPMATV